MPVIVTAWKRVTFNLVVNRNMKCSEPNMKYEVDNFYFGNIWTFILKALRTFSFFIFISLMSLFNCSV